MNLYCPHCKAALKTKDTIVSAVKKWQYSLTNAGYQQRTFCSYVANAHCASYRR